MYQISCRQRDQGRGLTDVHAVDPQSDPIKAGIGRWVILVHGFNNDRGDASKSWTRTVRDLPASHGDTRRVVLFFWPGDWSPSKFVSAPAYFASVHTAEETAQKLAAYLETALVAIPTLEISFVSHSLGGLVVLHALKLLRERASKISVREVMLMAAAVPVGYCKKWDRYGHRFSEVTAEGVLFSRHDTVLKHLFRPGQYLADRTPYKRGHAVGYTGGPSIGPPPRRWTYAEEMYEYRHGDYWTSLDSVDEIARVAGRPTLEYQLNLSASVKTATEPEDALSRDRLSNGNDDLPRDEPFSPRPFRAPRS